MKHIYLLFIVVFLFQGCRMPWDEESNIYKYFVFNDFFVDSNGSLYVEYRYNLSDDIKYIKLNTQSHTWEHDLNISENINKETVYFEDGKTIIKDSNDSIVFELTPPSIQEIEDTTGISLPDSMIYYNPFKSGDSYRWDRKTYVANVGIDYDQKNETFTKVYMFYLFYENDSWIIDFLDELPNDMDGLNNKYSLDIDDYKYFFDDNISLCHLEYNELTDSKEEMCFVKDDYTLTVKELFGDLVPNEYIAGIELILSIDYYGPMPDLLYFFDRDHNMHLFYNNTEKAKGKYFEYMMYEASDPTAPKYQQRIYR